MDYPAIKSGFVFAGVTLTLFCVSSYALYTATIDSGKGTELAGVGFIILSPLLGLFLILSIGAGLVASHIFYRRSAARSEA
jgi:hypothetical protein